jgi:hypothetical protein
MDTMQILVLFLALSGALNVALVTEIVARLAGVGMAKAILMGSGAAGTALMIFFTAVAAYR